MRCCSSIGRPRNMARRRKQGGSIYLSTNPQNNVPIGTPGQGVSIGRMGVWIYQGTGQSGHIDGINIAGGDIAFTPETVPVALEMT